MAELLLDSLEIENFRAFKHLKIEKLGRVNLIVGKNSVGKTALLEGLRIYTHTANFSTIKDILIERNEFSEEYNSGSKDLNKADLTEEFLYSINGNLFYGRNKNFDVIQQIKIGALETDVKVLTLSTRWYTYINERELTISTSDLKEVKIADRRMPGIEITLGDKTRSYFLNQSWDDIFGYYNDGFMERSIPGIYVPTNGLKEITIKNLWRFIVLNLLEDEILTALQIIVPKIERITLLDNPNNRDSPFPIVRVKGETKALTLRSLGDGLNRIFGIALALVNSKDGMLLVDEIENGLHFTTQLDLWRLIFSIARQLNVQVFATTHSWDCIQAFQEASSKDSELGMVIRLNNIDGEITATSFDERRLAIVTREQIEVR